MNLLNKQNKAVCFINLITGIAIVLIGIILVLIWVDEKNELQEGPSKLTADSELSQFVYIETDYLSSEISIYSENDIVKYSTYVTFYEERMLAISIPKSELKNYESIIESEEGTPSIKIEGKLVKTTDLDKTGIKDYIDYILGDEATDEEVKQYSFAYTLDVNDKPEASIFMLAFGIIICLVGAWYILRGIINLSGGHDQKEINKDDRAKYNFEKELEATNLTIFKGLIFLNSWLIIKGTYKTNIIKYQDITKYYELSETRRLITTHYVAIEVGDTRYKAPYSKRKDGDIETIFDTLSSKLNSGEEQESYS